MVLQADRTGAHRVAGPRLPVEHWLVRRLRMRDAAHRIERHLTHLCARTPNHGTDWNRTAAGVLAAW